MQTDLLPLGHATGMLVLCHALVLAETVRSWLLVPFCWDSVRRQGYTSGAWISWASQSFMCSLRWLSEFAKMVRNNECLADTGVQSYRVVKWEQNVRVVLICHINSPNLNAEKEKSGYVAVLCFWGLSKSSDCCPFLCDTRMIHWDCGVRPGDTRRLWPYKLLTHFGICVYECLFISITFLCVLACSENCKLNILFWKSFDIVLLKRSDFDSHDLQELDLKCCLN